MDFRSGLNDKKLDIAFFTRVSDDVGVEVLYTTFLQYDARRDIAISGIISLLYSYIYATMSTCKFLIIMPSRLLSLSPQMNNV
jgi:hypothetical protein